MSVQLMAAVFERGPGNPHQRLLLLALADHADEAGVCWPSVDRLAAKCAVSARQVQRTLQQLQADGWLVIDRGRGRGNTSLYRLPVARLLGNGDTGVGVCEPKGDARVGFPADPIGDTGDAKGDIDVAGKVTPASPEPSGDPEEPSIRPAAPALIDVTEVADWLTGLHPGLAANNRTAPPAAAAIAERITPEAARRLLEAAGHRTDRPAVIAHVLPAVIDSEVERRRKAAADRRSRAAVAAARRAPATETGWPDQVAGLQIGDRLAWLLTPEGAAWAEAQDHAGLRANAW